MKKFRAIYSDLAADVYYDPGSKSRRNAIYLSGFPAFPSPNAFIERLTSEGIIVFAPHYYGTFDSNGIFSFDSMLKTVKDTAEVIATEQSDSKPDFVPASTSSCDILIGQSFGGVAAVYAANFIPCLRKVVIASSGLRYPNDEVDTGLHEDFARHLEMVRTKWRNSYRLAPDAEWHHIISGKFPDAPSRYNTSLESIHILIGGRDAYFEPDKVIESNSEVCKQLLGPKVQLKATTIAGAGHPMSDIFLHASDELVEQIMS